MSDTQIIVTELGGFSDCQATIFRNHRKQPVVCIEGDPLLTISDLEHLLEIMKGLE